MAEILQADRSAQGSWVAEEQRLAVLQRTELLGRPPEPEFDRWTAALRRATGATAAALLLVDAAHVFVKSLSTADGAAAVASEIPLLEPLAEYLIGRADRVAPD